jgi:hypothetical protein
VAGWPILQHGVELGFDDCQPIWCQSLWSAGDWWARYSLDVMDSVMVDFTLDSGWVSEVRKFGKEAVDRCAACDGLDVWGSASWRLGPVQTTM